MPQTRRTFIATCLLTALAPDSAALAARASVPHATGGEDLDHLFNDTVDAIITSLPQQATILGIDTGKYGYAAMRSQLNDRSPAARAKLGDAARRLLDRSRKTDPKSVDGLKRPALLSLRFWLEAKIAASKFPTWDDSEEISPYVFSQLTGAYQTIPDFLNDQHPVRTREDVEAYIERLGAFATAIDQDTDRLRDDAARGVLAPDFALEKAINQLSDVRKEQANEKSSLAAALATRAQNIPGVWGPTAQRVLVQKVIPAIDRQRAAVDELRPRATHDAGVPRLPDGPAFYAEALRQNTTTRLAAIEIHNLGRELQAELTAEIDQKLKQQGMSRGNVGTRLRHLYDDATLAYPNTDEGKARILQETQELIASARARLPKAFRTLPRAAVIVKSVPSYREQSAPGGYFLQATIDGSRPGVYYINLRDLSEIPRWGLPTLTFHEADPGHHLQTTLENESPALPLAQKALTGFNAYVEGWALYAEQLAAELGVYKHQPLGNLGVIGHLHAALFRAVRLVVDTGIHHLRWSREQAVRHFMDALGDKESAATTEVDRYCVWPGQACSYMIGKTTFLRLRKRAKAALGSKFDIRDFHDAALLAGAMPLDVLEREIDRYVAHTRRKRVRA
jgi:uncharacterized protein (DUF885 family)